MVAFEGPGLLDACGLLTLLWRPVVMLGSLIGRMVWGVLVVLRFGGLGLSGGNGRDTLCLSPPECNDFLGPGAACLVVLPCAAWLGCAVPGVPSWLDVVGDRGPGSEVRTSSVGAPGRADCAPGARAPGGRA